ncbi:MAG: hypothetical protein U0527_08790 [Candidatus Eisenbacteria bacterium]
MAPPDDPGSSTRRFSLNRVSWGGREVSALLLLGLVFVLLSGLLQLTSVTRLAAEDAATQCGIVTQSLIKGIGYRLGQEQADPLAGLAEDPVLAQALSVAASHAPSIAWVAICDSTGIALVHTNPAQIGTLVGYSPALPQPKSFAEGLNVLFALRRPPFTYAYDRVLKVGIALPFDSHRRRGRAAARPRERGVSSRAGGRPDSASARHRLGAPPLALRAGTRAHARSGRPGNPRRALRRAHSRDR